jgi:hypothetical protein
MGPQKFEGDLVRIYIWSPVGIGPSWCGLSRNDIKIIISNI